MKNGDIEDLVFDNVSEATNIEPVDANLRQQEIQNQTLNLNNLNKIYPNGKKAVNNLSLTMYKGQIFALLGTFFTIILITL